MHRWPLLFSSWEKSIFLFFDHFFFFHLHTKEHDYLNFLYILIKIIPTKNQRKKMNTEIQTRSFGILVQKFSHVWTMTSWVEKNKRGRVQGCHWLRIQVAMLRERFLGHDLTLESWKRETMEFLIPRTRECQRVNVVFELFEYRDHFSNTTRVAIFFLFDPLVSELERRENIIQTLKKAKIAVDFYSQSGHFFFYWIDNLFTILFSIDSQVEEKCTNVCVRIYNSTFVD